MSLLFKILTSELSKKLDEFEPFVEDNSFQKGFGEHYRQRLLPLVRAYEIDRLKALSQAKNKIRILLPVMIMLPILSFFCWDIAEFDPDIGEILFYANLLGIGCLYAYALKSINQYTKSVKDNVFPRILEFLGDFVFSSTNPEFDKILKSFEDFSIIPSHSRFECEDHISGNYNSVAIQLFEADLQRRRRRGYRTIFSGLIIKLEVKKKFEKKTVIKTDKGSIGNWFRDSVGSMNTVRLEDPEFERVFEVYSEDQVESRYLLTPTFMERLLKVRETFKSGDIQCSFYNKSFLMLIPISGSIFEPGPITEREDFIDDAKSLLSEMELIFGIADTLKLDMNTGL